MARASEKQLLPLLGILAIAGIWLVLLIVLSDEPTNLQGNPTFSLPQEYTDNIERFYRDTVLTAVDNGATIDVTVRAPPPGNIPNNNFYVYKTAYYSNLTGGSWESFELINASNQGATPTGWIRGGADRIDLPVPSGELYVIAYTCREYDTEDYYTTENPSGMPISEALAGNMSENEFGGNRYGYSCGIKSLTLSAGGYAIDKNNWRLLEVRGTTMTGGCTDKRQTSPTLLALVCVERCADGTTWVPATSLNFVYDYTCSPATIGTAGCTLYMGERSFVPTSTIKHDVYFNQGQNYYYQYESECLSDGTWSPIITANDIGDDPRYASYIPVQPYDFTHTYDFTKIAGQDTCTPSCPSSSTITCGQTPLSNDDTCGGSCSGTGTQCSSGTCNTQTGQCETTTTCASECDGKAVGDVVCNPAGPNGKLKTCVQGSGCLVLSTSTIKTCSWAQGDLCVPSTTGDAYCQNDGNPNAPPPQVTYSSSLNGNAGYVFGDTTFYGRVSGDLNNLEGCVEILGATGTNSCAGDPNRWESLPNTDWTSDGTYLRAAMTGWQSKFGINTYTTYFRDLNTGVYDSYTYSIGGPKLIYSATKNGPAATSFNPATIYGRVLYYDVNKLEGCTEVSPNTCTSSSAWTKLPAATIPDWSIEGVLLRGAIDHSSYSSLTFNSAFRDSVTNQPGNQVTYTIN